MREEEFRLRSTLLGREKETGRGVYIEPENRATHIQVIGSTGTGKSKFMEHLIHEDIINNNGLCLIDPHGHLYDNIVNWCVTKGLLGKKKILLFNPAEVDWTFAFNPLKVSSSNISFHVSCMVQACAKVWGGEDTNKTPLLKRCLRIVFHILAEKNLSLIEAEHIINPVGSEIRNYITRDIKNPAIRGQWNNLERLNVSQFSDKFESTVNRLMEFIYSPIIRRTIGQTENTIDFNKIMDEGYIVLINLSPQNEFSDDDANVLGTLLVNDLFTNARGRPDGCRPFYFYIDECARFINEDIGRILDEGRKFGLHLILAHQHLSQLKEAGESIYRSVMTDAKTKAVFGGLDPDDAEILAKKVFMGEINLEEPKEILNKPTVVGYIKTWLNSYSKGESRSKGENSSRSRGQSNSQSEAISTTDESEQLTDGSSVSDSYTDMDGYSSSDTMSESEGESETFLPVLEEMPTQVYSLQEQVYKAMALMINQPTQQAIIKIPNEKTSIIKTPTIRPAYARDERVNSFKEECYKLADFVKSKTEVERDLENRFSRLKRTISTSPPEVIEKKRETIPALEPLSFRDDIKPAFVKKLEQKKTLPFQSRELEKKAAKLAGKEEKVKGYNVKTNFAIVDDTEKKSKREAISRTMVESIKRRKDEG